MIKISEKVLRKQPNFWNHCLFHPTDAVEDPWGRRILDRLAEDGSIDTVRIYSMFEDIVYLDEEGNLNYDFRLNDLRLDYMIEKGFNLIIAYAGMPDIVAETCANKTSVSKNKTRYKGKMWNSAPPKDYKLWEEMCYEYTKHIVERYGIETVSRWRIQCFNEPDIASFFLSEQPKGEAGVPARAAAYCKLYEAFEKGVRRASEEVVIGGPCLAHRLDFLEIFLDYVKEHNLKLDYIPFHNYGTNVRLLNEGSRPISVANNMERHRGYMDVLREKGFDDREVIYDEWGGSSAGFYNREECPPLIFRETEVFSSFFVKFIYELIHDEKTPSKLLICLSGQHEMVEDFSGFRNFFTLNFISKPIYNAYVMASKLGEDLLESETANPLLSVIPTKNEKGETAILLTYAGDTFEEDLPELAEEVRLEGNLAGKTVTAYCIDKETTNPYRLYQKMGIGDPTEEELRILREEGTLKPVFTQSAEEKLNLKLTPNSTYLITVK